MKKTLIAMSGGVDSSLAAKPDSQDICFVPDWDYAGVIEKHTGAQAGVRELCGQLRQCFRSAQGRDTLHHRQRKGLGISAAAPLYVCDICPNTNEVVLGSNEELFRREADVIDFNWISGSAPAHELRCKAKIRYRHPEQWATVTAGRERRPVRIVFDEPQRRDNPRSGRRAL